MFAKCYGGDHFWAGDGVMVRCERILEKVGVLKGDGFVGCLKVETCARHL